MQKPAILLYQDYIHNNGQLHAALVRVFGHAQVGFCDARDILSGILDDGVSLFVMPGGADLYYCEKLNGPGNARIRAYVEGGGSYLGICAGAYYACAALNWAAGTDQEISGARELGFYNGTATGPVMEFLEGQNINGSWLHAAPVTYHDDQGDITALLAYEAGPVFTGGDAVILARYEDGGAAIIETKIGQGRVILSSPHIERAALAPYRHRNGSYDYDMAVMRALASHHTQQDMIWNRVLGRLLAGKAVSHAA